MDRDYDFWREKVLVSGDAAFRASDHTYRSGNYRGVNLRVSGHSFMEGCCLTGFGVSDEALWSWLWDWWEKLETRMKCNQQKNKEMNLVPSPSFGLPVSLKGSWLATPHRNPADNSLPRSHGAELGRFGVEGKKLKIQQTYYVPQIKLKPQLWAQQSLHLQSVHFRNNNKVKE